MISVREPGTYKILLDVLVTKVFVDNSFNAETSDSVLLRFDKNGLGCGNEHRLLDENHPDVRAAKLERRKPIYRAALAKWAMEADWPLVEAAVNDYVPGYDESED